LWARRASRGLSAWWQRTWPPPGATARAVTAAASWGAGWQDTRLPPAGCGAAGCQGEHPGPELLPDGRPRVITHTADCSPQIRLNLNYGTGQVGYPEGGEDNVELR
jgi:hypothetical protein